MNQAILSKKLANAFTAVQTGAPTLPILSHFYFGVKDGTATLAGCDLSTFVIEQFEIDAPDFECCPPAQLFLKLVNAFDDDIKFTFKNDTLFLNGKDHKVRTVPAKEFPELPILPETQPAEFESSDLAYIITRVVYAAAGDKETREILKGVHFDFGEKIVASAADGFRGAFCEYDYNVELSSVTIPASFAVKVAKALSDKDTTVKMWTNESQAILAFDNTVMVSQLIVGNFVDVPRLLSREYCNKATVNKNKFEKARKRLEIFAQGDLVELDYNDNSITLFAESPESGENKENIECEVEGEPYKTAFNQLYFRDVFAVCGSEVAIQQNGANSQFVIYTPDKYNKEMHMVMPLQVRDKPAEN